MCRAGKQFISPHFLWFGSPSPTGSLRFGVTVSKRVGLAVVRNRVKRLLREAFRQHKALFPRRWMSWPSPVPSRWPLRSIRCAPSLPSLLAGSRVHLPLIRRAAGHDRLRLRSIGPRII